MEKKAYRGKRRTKLYVMGSMMEFSRVATTGSRIEIRKCDLQPVGLN